MIEVDETEAQQADKLANRAKLTPIQLRRKVALLEAGVTTVDVARAAGVTRQTAWEVLMGVCTSRRVAEKYAELTGKTLEDLFPALALSAEAGD